MPCPYPPSPFLNCEHGDVDKPNATGQRQRQDTAVYRRQDTAVYRRQATLWAGSCALSPSWTKLQRDDRGEFATHFNNIRHTRIPTPQGTEQLSRFGKHHALSPLVDLGDRETRARTGRFDIADEMTRGGSGDAVPGMHLHAADLQLCHVS